MKTDIIKPLIHIHLLSPKGILYIVYCLFTEGITLMAALRFASRFHAGETALVYGEHRLTYHQLYHQANALSAMLLDCYHLEKGMQVGLFCRNHTMMTLLLPALSRLGVRIKLINTDINTDKVVNMVNQGHFSLFIFDEEYENGLKTCSTPHITTEALNKMMSRNSDVKLPHILRGGDITIYTGGSSGHYGEATRKPGILQFLPPFFALIKQIHIQDYKSVLIALPFYHGFGLATWIISLVMGKKVCLMRHFDVSEALRIIKKESIEVLPVVPAILSRIWQEPEAMEKMNSVRCIICGGDKLDRELVEQTHHVLGPVCYNLYGTTEGGFLMMATPHDLEINQIPTLGKPISGVACDIRNVHEGTGELWIRCSWAMAGKNNQWQPTGDLVRKDSHGYYFYQGRTDRMVVCGGENVYPENVERVLNSHPSIAQSFVYGAPDARFGYVLHAKVELHKNGLLSPDDLQKWLRSRVSRAEMPHHIEFVHLNMLSTGKINHNTRLNK